MLDRFLEWFFASQRLPVVFVREGIRTNSVLYFCAHTFVRMVQGLEMAPQRVRVWFVRAATRRLRAILDARAVGGTITVDQLEQILRSRIKSRQTRVLYIAEAPERRQIETMLDAARFDKKWCQAAPPANLICEIDPCEFDLIISAPVPAMRQEIAGLLRRVREPTKMLRVGEDAKRSCYQPPRSKGPSSEQEPTKQRLINRKLSRGDPLRVVFVNDLGFQYGAGIALKRQVASLLMKGWQVSVVAWRPGDQLGPPMVTGVERFETWEGVHSVFAHDGRRPLDSDKLITEMMRKIQSLGPDVVITGNLHGTEWLLGILPKLRQLGIYVVAYMHDTYLVTGRCAQPLACELFRTGCDARCPTWNEHPRLDPDKIAAAWREREKIFTGNQRVSLVGNSQWSRNIALQRFGAAAAVNCIYLGLDHELFAPLSKSTVRRLLGIDNGKLTVIMSAVNVHDRWKGGRLFQEVHKALVAREDVDLILVGQSSETLKCTKAFGLVRDERLMPLILNAADIFVSTAIAESFGQSALEASACAVPVVAIDVGGLSDVVVPDETGILVKEPTAATLLSALERLVTDPRLREHLGQNGRRRVEDHFTLFHQGNAWVEYLNNIC
jgi:glycosyltransferase involved in cell wall biosynthesis